jgi:signal recognition particle receptor subunit beta
MLIVVSYYDKYHYIISACKIFVYIYIRSVFLNMDISVIVAVLVGVLGLVLYYFLVMRNKKSTKKDLILLVGPCGGGKTVLGYRLQGGKTVSTVTSMKPHLLQVKSESNSSKTVSVIDFPGHPRLRSQLVSEYLARAKKIVFVIDSANNVAKLREAAEYLYDLFIDPSFESGGPPVMVVCNKSDVPGALPAMRTKLRLQEEVEKIRKTRQSLQESNETGGRVVLGREGQPFSIDKGNLSKH